MRARGAFVALVMGALTPTRPPVAAPARPTGPGVLAPSTVVPPGSVPPALAAVAREVRDLPLPDRIDALSAALLGAPYRLDGLGEGVPPDGDPLARYDSFDCQTFVEEVLALALARDRLDAGRVRRSLRYGDATPSFATRRHFTELQWVPGLVADGWIEVTTARYGPTRALQQEVDAAFWAAWRGRSRFAAIHDDRLPTGTQALDILPLDAAVQAAPRLPAGAVVLIVREPKPGNPVWTTHMGVLTAGARLRHASQTRGRVVEVSLADYLRDAGEWTGWPVAGIALLEPRPWGAAP